MFARMAIVFAFLVVGCSSHEDAVCTGGSCVDAASTVDAVVEAAPSSDAAVEADSSCAFTVDEAGVTHGCNRGGQGPGDRDDGGGIDTGAPDVAMDASDLPFGSPCWDNAQCASGICFDYKVKGTACTQRCSTNADCPPSSLGCNGMGVCRVGS
jgi:hypothetical protein